MSHTLNKLIELSLQKNNYIAIDTTSVVKNAMKTISEAHQTQDVEPMVE